MTRTDRKLVERKVLGELLTGKYSGKSLPMVPREKRREAARIEAKAIAEAMVAAKESGNGAMVSGSDEIKEASVKTENS